MKVPNGVILGVTGGRGKPDRIDAADHLMFCVHRKNVFVGYGGQRVSRDWGPNILVSL